MMFQPPYVFASAAMLSDLWLGAFSVPYRALLDPDEVAEEEVLPLRERAHAAVHEREDEKRPRADVADTRAVRRPRRHDVVPGLTDDLEALPVARCEEELRRDVQVGEAGARGRPRRGGDGVPGSREHDLAPARREARRLQIPPGVLRGEEGTRVRAVGVRGPEAVRLTLRQVDVHDPGAVGRERGVRPVHQQ